MIARNENKNIFGFYKHFFFFTINIARVDVIATFHYLPSLQKNAWFLGKYNYYYKYVWIQSYSGADMTITHDFYIFFFCIII